MQKSPILFALLVAVHFSSVDMSGPVSSFIRAQNQQVAGYTEDTEGHWNGDYFFIFATDPQPGLINQVKEKGNGSEWNEEIRRIGQIHAALNQITPKPKFMLIGGDILNAFPTQEYRNAQYADIQQAFSEYNIPIFVIGGNHDVGNVPTNESRDIYNREFGDEYYSFWVGGVYYIVLDSQYLFDSSMTPERAAAQERWFTTVLEKAKNSGSQHVVLFMHIPIFINNVDEKDTYFSIKKTDRLALLNRLADARIKNVFSGHYHREGGGNWTRVNGNGEVDKIEIVVSSAIGCQLGEQQAGINVVKVTEEQVSHTYYSIPDIPTLVDFN